MTPVQIAHKVLGKDVCTDAGHSPYCRDLQAAVRLARKQPAVSTSSLPKCRFCTVLTTRRIAACEACIGDGQPAAPKTPRPSPTTRVVRSGPKISIDSKDIVWPVRWVPPKGHYAKGPRAATLLPRHLFFDDATKREFAIYWNARCYRVTLRTAKGRK
jgi:hypothetical protein